MMHRVVLKGGWNIIALLANLVQKTDLLRDTNKITLFQCTGCLEDFPSLVTKYCLKGNLQS